MKLALLRLSHRSRQNFPVVERLEARTLLSAAPTAGTAAGTAKTKFPVSDIFGAGAGVPIWQNGAPVLPASSPAAGGSFAPPPSLTFQPTQTANDLFTGNATVPGGAAIFSLLPVLPPDGLAAEIIGLIDPLRGGSANFRSGYNNHT